MSARAQRRLTPPVSRGVALIFEHDALRSARRMLPVVQPLSALLLLIAGAYIIYYWLTLGRLPGSVRL